MRALCFCDLHKTVTAAERLAERAVAEEVDVLLSAGDLAIDFVHVPELYDALAAARKPVLCVPGNHDGVEPYARSLERAGLTDLDGERVQVGGVTLVGWGYRWGAVAPAAPGWRDPPNGRSGRPPDPDLRAMTALIADVDPRRLVLLSHLPPWGVKVARTETDDLGDKALRRWVEAHRPAAVVCGHVHHPKALTSRIGNTLVVNGGREGFVLQV